MIHTQGCEGINILDCIFRNNRNIDSAGALALYTCKGRNTIRNCFFQENCSKNSDGGAILFKVLFLINLNKMSF